MKHGQPLTNEEQNVVRVIFAALLAVIVLVTVFVFQCGQPDAHVVALVPAMLLGGPTAILNVVVWRVRMHW